MIKNINIRIKRELFSFSGEQDWINKAQSRYANCGVRKGMYITVDSHGNVMHMGKCFMTATKNNAYPVTVYELATGEDVDVDEPSVLVGIDSEGGSHD
jgi:hypothetical protein